MIMIPNQIELTALKKELDQIKTDWKGNDLDQKNQLFHTYSQQHLDIIVLNTAI